jgi:Kef-type K+ transport system membrane component KefB
MDTDALLAHVLIQLAVIIGFARLGGLAANDLAVLLVMLLCSGLITHEIGIFAIFGAFMLGAVFHDETEFRQAVLTKLNDFVTVFFLALIVINVGLNAGILNSTAFFMLVMMAVITTFMTAPLLRLGLKKAPETSLAHIPEPVQRRPEQAQPVVSALT